ncbi:MAG: endopeptidase La [Zetaproteobacteria bacterium]|nr:endopeptidase La [Zetaproteobacteria bacterium]
MSDLVNLDSRQIQVPLLPLRDILVFPSNVIPLFVGRDKSIRALEQAMSASKEILLSVQRKAKVQDPGKEDIYSVGTISTILQMLRLPDGTVKVLVEGKCRAKIKEFLCEDEYFSVACEEVLEEKSDDLESEALLRTVRMAFDNYMRLNKRMPPEMLMQISQIESPSKFADTLVAHLTSLKLSDKQGLLEEANAVKRLETIYGFIQSEIEIIRVEKKIRARVKRQMEKTQKEYYLNEQMAAIQKELGDKDEAQSEIAEMEQQIAKRKLSDEARERLSKEVRKLKTMSPLSAEATVVRNYVDTVLSLPWGERTKDIRNIHFAAEVLNRDHFGLEKVKDRILEYLSVRHIVDALKGPILCLVGPPGVGKTSLARSIAESMGRKFVRLSFGGVHDQAEIRGHRKTYIGSMPGKIIMALKKAGSSNPVMLLDEIDKMSRDYRGDPSAALLEVLDPEQNTAFSDHYLDLDYDLSSVLFIATANSLDAMPAPLLDRMEIIRIAGYTEEEKCQISKRYLIPKQLKRNGLDEQKIVFSSRALGEMIQYYTREAGVRSLEREISSVLRKCARKHVAKLHSSLDAATLAEQSEGEEQLVKLKPFSVKETITPLSIDRYLGPRRYRVGSQSEHHEIGLCTGLAWTPTGGELLTIEVTILQGKGKLTITGKLGDVMQESAQAALSYVRSRAQFLGIEADFYQKVDIHIHVPEGAIPKDGPSAGLTMATALTSALTGKPVSRDIAMTGEVTLRGRALPIGGLKEKALAAHRAGIKKIIFPCDNAKDLAEIPKSTKKDIDFVSVEHMDEVLVHALVWDDQQKTGDKEDQLLVKLKKMVKTPVAERFDANFAH